MQHETSANYDYVLATALSLAQPTIAPRVLDFGCGTGALIIKARAQGLDFWGADTYEGGWADGSNTPAAAFIRAIDAGRFPIPTITLTSSSQIKYLSMWLGQICS
jgi:hypothetical protein